MLALGRPLSFVAFLLTCCLFVGLVLLFAFGCVYAVGRLGIGPMAAEAMRDKEYWSVVLGSGVLGLLAWPTLLSIQKQFRNWSAQQPVIEGTISKLTEYEDYSEEGLGAYAITIVQSREYLLPFRLRKVLQPGMRVRILCWPGTGKVRAVWLARR